MADFCKSLPLRISQAQAALELLDQNPSDQGGSAGPEPAARALVAVGAVGISQHPVWARAGEGIELTS